MGTIGPGGNATMERNSVYLFKVFGIPIRVHVSWLIIFALVTLSLATEYFPHVSHYQWPAATYWVVGVITSLLFFVSVLLHELAHSVVARWRGMKVRDIVLFIFGGVSELGEEPESAQTEFIMAFVGPLTSFVISGVSLLIYWLTKSVNEPVSAGAHYLSVINLFLGIFNLIPGFPLDGGRILRAIMWGISGDLQRSTRWASRLGSFIAYAFIFAGICWMAFLRDYFNGLWLIFIGWFLNNAAQSSYSNMLVKHVLIGHKASEIVHRNCPRVPPDQPMDALVNEYILAEGVRYLPVVEGERLLGAVTWQSVKALPPEQWSRMRASDAMIPVEQVKAIGPDCDLWSALGQMNSEAATQLAVVQDGQLVGLLTRDAIMGFLQLHAEPTRDDRR
jgi:Zn-dependent protease/CBS domain-containing protein